MASWTAFSAASSRLSYATIFKPDSLIMLDNPASEKKIEQQKVYVSLFRFLLLCTLQSYYERNGQIKLLCSFDDTLRDIIAPHNSCD